MMELDVQRVAVAAREITQVNSQWTYEREGGAGVELAVLHLEDRSFVTFGIDTLIEALTNLRDSSRDRGPAARAQSAAVR
jgi:hypothetical protein